MNPGDKVRFLHSKGEGIIRKVIDHRTFEVEIEDGFIIPATKSDLVKVSGDENQISGKVFSPSKELNSSEETFVHQKGNVSLSFIPFNDKIHSVYLINESGKTILFSFFTNSGEEVKGVASGSLEKGKTIKITEADISDFENWPEYILQILYFSYGSSQIVSPLTKRIKFKASSFFKKKQSIPIIKKEGYLIRLDSEESLKIPSDLAEKMFETSEEVKNREAISRPSDEIDLHIEKLVEDHSKMSNAEILEIQLKTFEKKLDHAIVSGMDEIIFIHGVGNGVLKNHMHKLLSQRKNIQFFKDARKEKFGYGATLVKIK